MAPSGTPGTVHTSAPKLPPPRPPRQPIIEEPPPPPAPAWSFRSRAVRRRAPVLGGRGHCAGLCRCLLPPLFNRSGLAAAASARRHRHPRRRSRCWSSAIARRRASTRSLANAMDAAAIAILFSTFFAAHSQWNLISGAAAFGLLALVTLDRGDAVDPPRVAVHRGARTARRIRHADPAVRPARTARFRCLRIIAAQHRAGMGRLSQSLARSSAF